MDICFRDGYSKNFHTFDHLCVYEIELTNIGDNETVLFTIFDKNNFWVFIYWKKNYQLLEEMVLYLFI